jgi:hypothetical protein
MAISRREEGLPGQLAGPIGACLLLAVIFTDLGPRLSLAAGAGAMAIAGFLWNRSRAGSIIVAVLGASTVMYRSEISETADFWVRPIGTTIILLVGWCLVRYEEAGNRPYAGLLLAMTLLAVWANVPDTEIPRLLLGSWVGLLPGLLIAGLPKLGWWAPAVAVPVIWMTAVAGAGRPGSIIGGWASMGILLLRPRHSTRVWPPLIVNAGLLLLTARVAGLRDSPTEAAAISLTGLAAAGALLWLLDAKPGRAQTASGTGA